MAVNRAKGTRDLLPESMLRRLAVIDTVREVFARFGFQPLETPAIERIETLMGKYGDEGDQLIYKILKRGEGGQRGEVDLALRYDLTVPLARVVAMNPGLPLPFKRYQIQPVWRADRPQKGRFREFTQCDVDIVGCEEMWADAEALAVVDSALRALGFTNFTIKLNHRALLRAIVEDIGAADRETPVLVAIDKLDKIGQDAVSAELERAGLSSDAVARVWELLETGGSEGLAALREKLPAALPSLDELQEVLDLAAKLGVPDGNIRFDPTLARGLSYYTGPVFEAVVEEPAIGSISGGGRYDGLIGIFGKSSIPAVGISLGLERILVVMEELGMFGELPPTATQVLVSVFSDDSRGLAMEQATALRLAGVNTELWMKRGGKLGKQFKYADKMGIPYVLTCGPDEREQGVVTLKHMASGEQWTLSLQQASEKVLGL
ncbi:MAG: histidine--tRNA ligase [Myxococcota bacterium]|nr:histidine--tRNA ligase [Myxococcota bacterium]